MFNYVLKRLLYFIPTLFVISLLAFGLSKAAPGDPVELLLQGGLQSETGQRSDLVASERSYLETARRLGMDKPPFYFGLSSQAYPDTIYRIVKKDRRAMLENLIAQYGNWEQITLYKDEIRNLEFELFNVPDTVAKNSLITIRKAVGQLYLSDRDPKIMSELGKIEQAVASDTSGAIQVLLGEKINALKRSYLTVKNEAKSTKYTCLPSNGMALITNIIIGFPNLSPGILAFPTQIADPFLIK